MNISKQNVLSFLQVLLIAEQILCIHHKTRLIQHFHVHHFCLRQVS